MEITSVCFIKSVAKVSECPQLLRPEIAVIGRSNVGKSSLINMLMGKQVAKASDKPGKTQLINFFLVNDCWNFVDLPGYGYAKESLENRRKWIDETHKFFQVRKPYILVLIDGSILPQKIDLDFIQSLQEENFSYVIIATKIDKASQKKVSNNIKSLKNELLKKLGYIPEIILTSSLKKTGRDRILSTIEEKISY